MAELVKMVRNGLTIEVYPQDVNHYKQGGFKVVDKKNPATSKTLKPEELSKDKPTKGA